MYYVCHGCLLEAYCMKEQIVELSKWLRTILVCHGHICTTYEDLLFLSALMSEDSYLQGFYQVCFTINWRHPGICAGLTPGFPLCQHDLSLQRLTSQFKLHQNLKSNPKIRPSPMAEPSV